MKKIFVLSSLFIGFSIIFSGALISYNLEFGGTDFLVFIFIISGFILFLIFLFMIMELMPNSLYSTDNHLSESEKKFLKENEIDDL